jgi:[acyl-carrier-protein] S-malonyltransferase
MQFAFVFPGQGSQALGMMQGYSDFPIVRETFAAASDVLRQDLWRLVNEGPADDLNQTVNTQPIMLVAGVAVFRAWCAAGGPLPIVMAGHSLAEYAALVCAQAMQFADAVALVRLRSQAMQDAVPNGEGAIAAVLGLDDAAVIEACREAAQGDVVEPANFNTPGQLVISGHKRAVDRAIEIAKAKGAKRAVILPMSIPAHCSLMRPAAQTLQPALARIMISAPVRWSQTIKTLAQAGAKAIVECGPGKVLVGFNRRIDDALRSYALADGAAIVETKAALAGES